MKKLALLAALLWFALPAYAAGLININTADAAALESLPGIGATKAAAIISYRSAHGTFASISAIENVSGIGPTTYAEIAALITVEGGTSSVAAAESASTSENTSDQSAVVRESPLVVDPGGDRPVATGADVAYSANVLENGEAADVPQVRWSFGDGSTATGQKVEKSYALPGTYLVHVEAAAGDLSADTAFTVEAKLPQVKIAGVSGAGIAVENLDTGAPLDLSLWQLAAGALLFTFPQGTEIAPGARVVFAPAITGLPESDDTALLYPSGAVAVSFGAGVSPAQPSAPAARSNQTEEVDAPPLIETHDAPEPVLAPASSTEVAAAGAALSPRTPMTFSSILKSPWTLGILGVLVFSAAAFMVL